VRAGQVPAERTAAPVSAGVQRRTENGDGSERAGAYRAGSESDPDPARIHDDDRTSVSVRRIAVRARDQPAAERTARTDRRALHAAGRDPGDGAGSAYVRTRHALAVRIRTRSGRGPDRSDIGPKHRRISAERNLRTAWHDRYG